MTMNQEDIIRRMSSEQIATASQRLQKELDSLIEDQRLLKEEQSRRTSARSRERE